MTTPKEHTLAMLAHYLQKVACDIINHELIIVYGDGSANWAGISRTRKIKLLEDEIERTRAFDPTSYTINR